MNPAWYEQQLYPLQDAVLAAITAANTPLYLTGGTALARGWTGHRYSDDLDLFVNDDPAFPHYTDRVAMAVGGVQGAAVRELVRDQRFFRSLITVDGVDLKIELVNDVPSRVGAPVRHAVLGLLDTPSNILANKVTAALDREEPKDLADIWALCTLAHLSLHEATEGAQGKAAGVFAPDLARVLARASAADFAVVRWRVAPAVDDFVQYLRSLAEKLLFFGLSKAWLSGVGHRSTSGSS